MPRISPSLIRQASHIDQRLVRLLPICRDLPSARNELRWLAEHAATKPGNEHGKRLLEYYIRRRARGEPLQYILGTEYFGDLEMKCRPGVLIPRPETAASVSHLASLLLARQLPPRLRVLDLCTGTGCIPLLLDHELRKRFRDSTTSAEIVAVDISPKALALAKENLAAQPGAADFITFHPADVLWDSDTNENLNEPPSLKEALHARHGHGPMRNYDILISNPPYISPKAFRTTTARSVRHYEPKLALVPPDQRTPRSYDGVTSDEDDAIGDLFYPAILRHAQDLDVKIMLLEVGDLAQALRVAGMIVRQGIWDHVEMWRDEPGYPVIESVLVDGVVITVRGRGSGRSVFAFRGEGRWWLDSDISNEWASTPVSKA
ncbi:hypothetical protein LTR78_009054 [Recurvomyces mirabilis]|uniref:S-adenosyl-L-methionine-dependent methyltransferase n=1 Tax=Recurvomyces mirabilis TaxID=574656 RepID=A0AAE0WIT1_9PEZI|nr:hypothetical protein LTR78_009054 [Recurvomyces mirabilis]